MDVPYVAVAEEGVLTMMIRFTIDLAGQSSLLDGSREVTLLLNNLMYSDRVLLEGAGTVTFPLEVNGRKNSEDPERDSGSGYGSGYAGDQDGYAV